MNKNNPEIADGRFTPGYVPHIPGGWPPSAPTGPAAFKRVMELWRSAFSDWHMTIEDLVAERDLVANRFTTVGTHDGPLFGIPPTGRRMVVHGMEFHRVTGGLVSESWISDDVPGIMVQLGVLEWPRGRHAPSGH